LYVYVYSRTNSSDLSFEITQEVFVSLWQRRNEVVFHTSLSAYLYTCVRYKIIRHINKSKLREKYYRDFLSYAGLSVDNSNEEQVNYNDINKLIEQKVSELPKKCQKIFRLSRYNDLSIKEISQLLNISHKTVENQLTIALKYLRKSLGKLMIFLV
jgi:RNA polymerase sigma-70 factor (ECF subfamily)